MNTFTYKRRPSTETRVGQLTIGGSNPIRIQSMANTDTNDIEASVAQARRIIDAGGELVRFTAQGTREAESLKLIRSRLSSQSSPDYAAVPLVADIHFMPAAADVAARYVEKVRINPGNYVDKRAKFEQLDYTDEEYQAELQRIHDRFVPFLNICREHHTAIRIGVNHGSLSDRIMSRYGDTPHGIVESCMEFLRICVAENFTDVVISIKASNTFVMIESVRLLVETMDKENMHFPLHLGVTEAGDGEDGRIKSAFGIGALLADGIGDTIRVSLSEAPEAEIPVARNLVDYFEQPDSLRYRTAAYEIVSHQSTEHPRSTHGAPTEHYEGRAYVHYVSTETSLPDFQLHAAADLGKILYECRLKDLVIENQNFSAEVCQKLADDILQAARLKMSKTEYISCPGCGRTLYDLQATIARIKAATASQHHLKIGIMGCIVNGPGEMADADYGYVGAARGCVSLYKGKQRIEMNVPESEAVDHLVALIKQNGDWRD